jgi:hypothetical protein
VHGATWQEAAWIIQRREKQMKELVIQKKLNVRRPFCG